MHSQIIYPMGNKSTGSEDVTLQTSFVCKQFKPGVWHKLPTGELKKHHCFLNYLTYNRIVPIKDHLNSNTVSIKLRNSD